MKTNISNLITVDKFHTVGILDEELEAIVEATGHKNVDSFIKTMNKKIITSLSDRNYATRFIGSFFKDRDTTKYAIKGKMVDGKFIADEPSEPVKMVTILENGIFNKKALNHTFEEIRSKIK